MNNLDDQLLIHELAERAGVSVRTIRYYIAEGLLPAPTTRGRYAYYSQEYLDLIELIRRLKEAYLPLREIRALVLNLPAEKVKLVLEQNAGLSQEELLRAVRDVAQEYQEVSDSESALANTPVLDSDSAASYAGKILEGGNKYPASMPQPAVHRSRNTLGQEAVDPFDREDLDFYRISNNELPGTELANHRRETQEENSWQRIEVAPGVELHVRMAEHQKFQERIRKLIGKLARELLRT